MPRGAPALCPGFARAAVSCRGGLAGLGRPGRPGRPGWGSRMSGAVSDGWNTSGYVTTRLVQRLASVGNTIKPHLSLENLDKYVFLVIKFIPNFRRTSVKPNKAPNSRTCHTAFCIIIKIGKITRFDGVDIPLQYKKET